MSLFLPSRLAHAPAIVSAKPLRTIASAANRLVPVCGGGVRRVLHSGIRVVGGQNRGVRRIGRCVLYRTQLRVFRGDGGIRAGLRFRFRFRLRFRFRVGVGVRCRARPVRGKEAGSSA